MAAVRSFSTTTWQGPRRPQRQVPRMRVLWLMVAAILLAATIWGRLAYWQVAEHHQLAQVAYDQHVARITLPATRGVIYDRQMRPLAINTTVYSVYLSPDFVPSSSRQRVAASLANVLGVKADDVMKVLVSTQKFAYVASRQPMDRAEALKKLNLPGVGLQAEQQRTYLPGGAPDSTLAANLLGFVNYDGQGQRGVEAFYQDRLSGKSGYVSTYRDLAGRDIVLGDQTRRDPVNGADLVLSIDSDVQYAAEQALAAGVKAAKAESGSVVLMDPKTGGILAWATYPSYDANKFTTVDPSLTRDPVVSDTYEPGSIMKVVTLSGALDQGKITPTTTINDPGFLKVGGVTIRDWDLKNHGTVTMTNVLEKSLNVGAIKAQQAEGPDAYYRYLQAFGFGAASGVDVADEAANPLRPLDQWRESELATASFGQGIAVNMVQMTAAVNVAANAGKYVPPHVVERVNGQPGPGVNAPMTQAVSPQTATSMTKMMESVVQSGSGYTARVPGFELDQAGKTGTSQIPENGQYSTDHVWASFAGFLPADNPRFTMLVMVRKPNNGSFDHNEGYYVSGPIWRDIAKSMVLQWRITPDPR